jgi:pyruvate dehydrogenase E2 component (dihydrolipoamide acetyltransferase)
MPQMGLTMEAGTVLKWLKQAGDRVEKDEPLMEIQTDKVSLEVTSDVEGTLLGIVVEAGKEVPVGTVVAWVGQAGEAVPRQAGTVATPAAAAAANPATAAPAPAVVPLQEAPGGHLRATPAARARARALGVELAGLKGSGPAGRIQARDVEAGQAAAAMTTLPHVAAAPPAQPATGAYREIPVTGMRKVIADRMVQSFHSAVPVLLTTEVVMDRADRFLAEIAGEYEQRAGGKPGYLPLIIRASAAALRAHPRINAHFLGNVIRQFSEVNIGVAVSLEDGLTVPVIREADRKGLAEIGTAVKDLAGKARNGSLALSDLEGGTFTVSNLGGYQIGAFMPVINPPQAAILGVGRSSLKPVVRDGKVEVLPVLPLSLVFDHRAVDGAPAAAFLSQVKELLEEPYRLLL